MGILGYFCILDRKILLFNGLFIIWINKEKEKGYKKILKLKYFYFWEIKFRGEKRILFYLIFYIRFFIVLYLYVIVIYFNDKLGLIKKL